MKRIFQLIAVSVLFGCVDNFNNKKEEPEQRVEIIQAYDSSVFLLKKVSEELQDRLAILTKKFSSDSASIMDYYSMNHKASSIDELERKINTVNKLIDVDFGGIYDRTNTELRPLLKKIVENGKISSNDALLFADMYSFYDSYSGEGLLSNSLTGFDDYNLVLKTIKILVDQSLVDTTSLLVLIELNDSIRSNIELAEMMNEYVNEAVKSNPAGYLEMYRNRSSEARINFSLNAMMWGDPDKQIISIFQDLSQNETSESSKETIDSLLDLISAPRDFIQ